MGYHSPGIEKHRMNYIETSALDSVNISHAFKDMVSSKLTLKVTN
jgi:hypothetical protein